MMPDMPKVDLGRPATYDDLVAVPDILVAEIVDGELWTSPRPAPRHARASSRLARAKKLRIYAEHGVRYAWLVDPIARMLEVLRLEQGRWSLLDTYAGNAAVHAEPFEAIALELGALWEDEGT